MKTEQNTEAQEWADQMESRARALAQENLLLRVALRDIKDATRPLRCFADAEKQALSFIEMRATSALANTPGQQRDERS
jgi:hypothetical protein